MIQQMRRRNAYIVSAFILIAALIVSSISGAGIVHADDEADRLAYEEKLKAAEAKKKELEELKQKTAETLESFKTERDNIAAYIDELDIQMNDIALKLFELQEEITATEDELVITREKLAAAKKKEADQYDIMKRRIQYMYENGDTSYAEVLLNSEDISDLLNQVEYMSSITDYDNSLLDRYIEAKEKVIEQELYLEASLEELRSMQETETLEKNTIDSMIALKNEEIVRYTEQIGITDEMLFNYIEDITENEKEIDQIIEDEQARQAEIERKRQEELERIRKAEEEERLRKLREEEAARKAAEAAEGKVSSTAGYDATAINDVVLTDETSIYKMIWPLPGDHRTFSKFGPRKAPIAGASTYHKGWDIGGEFGAPMVAVLAGNVVAVSHNSSAGYFVKVDHGDGVVSVYCHCSKQLVSEGDYVQQGQKIALVGSTGVSTAPHLHFAVTINNVYVDPDPYIGHLE